MNTSTRIKVALAALAVVAAPVAGIVTSASPASAAFVAPCAAYHPGFTGTWQDTSNGQYLGVVGNPQRPDSSGSVKFAPQSGVETENCFDMTHPAAYSADNGALVRWANAGRNAFGKYLACSPSGQLSLTNNVSGANGDTDWIFDGNGFTCMGRVLVLAPSGGVIGAAFTSANPGAESPIAFIPAS